MVADGEGEVAEGLHVGGGKQGTAEQRGEGTVEVGEVRAVPAPVEGRIACEPKKGLGDEGALHGVPGIATTTAKIAVLVDLTHRT